MLSKFVQLPSLFLIIKIITGRSSTPAASAGMRPLVRAYLKKKICNNYYIFPNISKSDQLRISIIILIEL